MHNLIKEESKNEENEFIVFITNDKLSLIKTVEKVKRIEVPEEELENKKVVEFAVYFYPNQYYLNKNVMYMLLNTIYNDIKSEVYSKLLRISVFAIELLNSSIFEIIFIEEISKGKIKKYYVADVGLSKLIKIDKSILKINFSYNNLFKLYNKICNKKILY